MNEASDERMKEGRMDEMEGKQEERRIVERRKRNIAWRKERRKEGRNE